jgi:hypothetical protein
MKMRVFINAFRSMKIMKNSQAAGSEANHGASSLATTFASRQQGEALIRALELSAEEIEEVSGGGDFTFELARDFIVKQVFPDPRSCMPADPFVVLNPGINQMVVEAAGLQRIG